MVACAWAEPSDLGSQRGIFIDSIYGYTLACCFASVRGSPKHKTRKVVMHARLKLGSVA